MDGVKELLAEFFLSFTSNLELGNQGGRRCERWGGGAERKMKINS